MILLDEPALELHPRAQRDFLRFINERLAPKHQVFYTTHSPFMVEAEHLDRVRLVEDRGRGVGAVVSSDVLSAEPDSFFPLQAALGFDIAQSLFGRPDNLLVQATSDYTYLTVISDHLKQFGRAISSSLGPIAFDRLAESLGARGVTAATPESLRKEIGRALSAGEVTVIHAPIVGGNA